MGIVSNAICQAGQIRLYENQVSSENKQLS